VDFRSREEEVPDPAPPAAKPEHAAGVTGFVFQTALVNKAVLECLSKLRHLAGNEAALRDTFLVNAGRPEGK
jgi:hypothetical protein